MKSRNLALGFVAAGALGASIVVPGALAGQDQCPPGSHDKQYCECPPGGDDEQYCEHQPHRHHRRRRHHQRYGSDYKDAGGTIIALRR
jgi:hypothetical protein